LTFRKLKHITIKQSLGVEKTRCIARFPSDSTAVVLIKPRVHDKMSTICKIRQTDKDSVSEVYREVGLMNTDNYPDR